MPHTLLLDVDGTLAPFNQNAGTEAVNGLLVKLFGSEGSSVGADFGRLYDALSLLHHGSEEPELVAIRNMLNSYKIQLPPELHNHTENFMWSRELWLKYLSEKHELNLTGKQITQIVDAYWESISLASQIYPSSENYLSKVRSKPFLITASDHRLIFRNNAIVYDPAFSERKKLGRILEQGFREMFKPSQIIIGDPFNKPSIQFWQRCMKTAKLPSPTEGIVVDDSKAVVMSAVKFGFKGYVLDRKGHYRSEDVRRSGAGYITELNQLDV